MIHMKALNSARKAKIIALIDAKAGISMAKGQCEVSDPACHGGTHQPGGHDLWFCDHHGGHGPSKDCPCILEHEWASGYYPNESQWICNQCGEEQYRHWERGDLEGGTCAWQHHKEMPSDMETPCTKCGHHDCADGHHGELTRCQTVGECSGMWYDVYINTKTNDTICSNCWETRHD